MAGKGRPKRADIDWETIEREYRAGQLSNSEIGRQFCVSEGAIRKRAKQEGWTKDLTKRVQQKVRDKLVREAIRDASARTNDDAVVESAANRAVELVRSHRQDIKRLATIAQTLSDELMTYPKEEEIVVGKGDKAQIVKRFTLKERTECLRNIAQAEDRRIKLERQAFNLDDNAGDDNAPDAIKITYYRKNQIGA